MAIQLKIVNGCYSDYKKQKFLSSKYLPLIEQRLAEHGLVLQIVIETINKKKYSPIKQKYYVKGCLSVLYQVYNPRKKIVVMSVLDNIHDLNIWSIKHCGDVFERKKLAIGGQ